MNCETVGKKIRRTGENFHEENLDRLVRKVTIQAEVIQKEQKIAAQAERTEAKDTTNIKKSFKGMGDGPVGTCSSSCSRRDKMSKKYERKKRRREAIRSITLLQTHLQSKSKKAVH